MKKIIAIILTFILCLGLVACGGASDGEFNSETNQKVEYGGISFEVPESWIKQKKEGSLLFETAKGSLFWVQIEDIGNNQKGVFDKYEAFMKENPKLVGDVTRENITVEDINAMKLEYVSKDNTGTYHMTDISFIDHDRCIMFCYLTDESDSGKSDFNKIIESIQI